MAKKKHFPPGGPRKPGVTADPRQQGLRAFDAGNFEAAITAWSGLDRGDPRVAAALAEAYFRKGLETKPAAGQIAAFEQAHKLGPGEGRYLYHLGLAHQRGGDPAGASRAYRELLRQRPNWPGAGAALALAALELDPRTDLAQLPGSTPAIQAAFTPVQALLLQKALPEPPAPDQPLAAAARLWGGLSRLQAGESQAALALFEDSQPLPSPTALATRRYYRGVAATRLGDPATALKFWQRIYEESPDFAQNWLPQNLAVLLTDHYAKMFGSAPAAPEGDQLEVPGPALLKLAAANIALAEAMLAALDRAANLAALKGDWPRAARLWETSRQLAGTNVGLGSPRPLLHNLALAYEAQELWLQAAETWRAMLKTRPRRSRTGEGEGEKEATATEREGPDEQQWAWVRQQVIECYKKAGQPQQAVAIFRQAIKADPQDLEMRMQLVAALEANEQEQAAYNELKRIAELDPYHLEAQIRLVDLESEKWNWPSANERLRTLAAHYRDNTEARPRLAGLFLKTGQLEQEYGLYDQALATYEEGQALDPANYGFPLNMARTEIDRSKPARARERLAQSLTLARTAGNPYAYGEIIDCWAALGQIKEARAVLAQAEASLSLEPEFYIVLSLLLFKHSPGMPPLNPFSELANLAGSSRKKATPALSAPPETEWSALARECLQKAEALHPADPALKEQIRNTLMLVRPDIALPYAQELVLLQPDDAHAVNRLPTERVTELFGSQDQEGQLVFYDAIPVYWPDLQVDILNPHYGEWYNGRKPPTDNQKPVPVYFLTVAPASVFLFGVGSVARLPGKPQRTSLAEQGLDLLVSALDELGIGAKTAGGYGQFIER